MINFILLLIIACLWIWGFNFLFKKKEIFGFFGDLMRDHITKWIVKPTIGCPACMSSIHGTLVYLSWVNLTVQHEIYYWIWPFFLICLVGINHIIIEHLYDTSE